MRVKKDMTCQRILLEEIMSEIDCEETKRHVHEYLHNELSEAEISDITAHLANCDSCEGDYDVENTLNNVINRACADLPPAELESAIMERIRLIQKGVAH